MTVDIRFLGASEAPAESPKVEDLGVEAWSLTIDEDDKGRVERRASVQVKRFDMELTKLSVPLSFQGAAYSIYSVSSSYGGFPSRVINDLSLVGVVL